MKELSVVSDEWSVDQLCKTDPIRQTNRKRSIRDAKIQLWIIPLCLGSSHALITELIKAVGRGGKDSTVVWEFSQAFVDIAAIFSMPMASRIVQCLSVPYLIFMTFSGSMIYILIYFHLVHHADYGLQFPILIAAHFGGLSAVLNFLIMLANTLLYTESPNTVAATMLHWYCVEKIPLLAGSIALFYINAPTNYSRHTRQLDGVYLPKIVGYDESRETINDVSFYTLMGVATIGAVLSVFLVLRIDEVLLSKPSHHFEKKNIRWRQLFQQNLFSNMTPPQLVDWQVTVPRDGEGSALRSTYWMQGAVNRSIWDTNYLFKDWMEMEKLRYQKKEQKKQKSIPSDYKREEASYMAAQRPIIDSFILKMTPYWFSLKIAEPWIFNHLNANFFSARASSLNTGAYFLSNICGAAVIFLVQRHVRAVMQRRVVEFEQSLIPYDECDSLSLVSQDGSSSSSSNLVEHGQLNNNVARWMMSNIQVEDAHIQDELREQDRRISGLRFKIKRTAVYANYSLRILSVVQLAFLSTAWLFCLSAQYVSCGGNVDKNLDPEWNLNGQSHLLAWFAPQQGSEGETIDGCSWLETYKALELPQCTHQRFHGGCELEWSFGKKVICSRDLGFIDTCVEFDADPLYREAILPVLGIMFQGFTSGLAMGIVTIQITQKADEKKLTAMDSQTGRWIMTMPKQPGDSSHSVFEENWRNVISFGDSARNRSIITNTVAAFLCTTCGTMTVHVTDLIPHTLYRYQGLVYCTVQILCTTSLIMVMFSHNPLSRRIVGDVENKIDKQEGGQEYLNK